MPDKDKDLKMISDQVAEDFLKNMALESKDDKDTQHFNLKKLIRSRPYVRKSNLVTDRSINFCWESTLRFNGFDLYITILRRSYIPPFADMYQDVIICSKYMLDSNQDGEKKDNIETTVNHQKVT